jgi:hypothetical protein
MRGRQQLSRRLAAEHVPPPGSLQQIGRVGLAALELLHRNRAGKRLHALVQIGLKPRDIEAQSLGNFFGAGIGALAFADGH